jgi:transposase
LEPDHSTIAGFIGKDAERIKGIFGQVLLECDELGLIKGEMAA